MATLLKTTGFLFSILPYAALELITKLLSRTLIFFPNKRKRIIFSNLKHAFPNWPEGKIRSVGLISAAQMFEMGFFSLTYPSFSERKRKETLSIDKSTEGQLSQLREQKKPVIFLLPHVTLFETLAVSQSFRPIKGKKLGAIYRPNRNLKLDNWIRKARSSTGIELFSRDTAIWEAKKFLRSGNWLVLLFDQHSGIQGCHSYFLNRFASISTLPGLFAKSSEAKVFFAYPKRTSFFKSSLQLTELSCPPEETPFVAHEILSKLIKTENGLPEWLWAHERWKTQQNFRFHLRHRHKREKFPKKIPRTTKFWIRMPNWLGDVVMTLPLIDAIRKGRPDASLTLLAHANFKELFSELGIADGFIALPNGSEKKSWRKFLSHRMEYPSLIINFANSFRSDFQCFALGAPNRYGICMPGRKRPLLTHSWNPPSWKTEKGVAIHQVRLWEEMLQHFGLNQELDFSSVSLPVEKVENKIGILPGSANDPSKRWPMSNWKELFQLIISSDKEYKIYIYGASKEASIATSIASGLNKSKVFNQCGETSLVELAKEVASCSTLIGNDSGGMHLGNSLGTNCIVLFGPTNPLRTKPFYNSPVKIIQPTNCPQKGGLSLKKLKVNEVWQVLESNISIKNV